jgi:hypothetical protein
MPKYVAWLGGSRKLLPRLVTDEAEETQTLSLWDPGLEAFHDALDEPTLRLSAREADYLRNSILQIRDVSGRPLIKDLVVTKRNSPQTEVWDLTIVRKGGTELAPLVTHGERLSAAWRMRYRRSLGSRVVARVFR